MDRVAGFLAERTVRRFVALALFVGLIVLFRHLLILLVFFVAFERLLAVPSDWLARRTRLGRKPAVGLLALLFLGLLAGAAAFGVGRGIRAVIALRDTLPDRISSLRETALYQQAREHLKDADKLIDGARHYATGALGYLSAFGHILLYATIGFILAVVFILERDELHEFAHSIPPQSLKGTLLRWFGHVADAMVVTLQFQLVVAACNAVMTLPVILFVIGPQHAAALGLMIFGSGLIPVVGNFLAGAVLTFLAWQARGWYGLIVFTCITFVLHKIESYYLSPRLASRHVRLPGFVLIVSLIAWEHLLGLQGLLLSFPFLFVANRIQNELRAEAPIAAAAPADHRAA
jgi:predicted PurR-regulated permease PerM